MSETSPLDLSTEDLDELERFLDSLEIESQESDSQPERVRLTERHLRPLADPDQELEIEFPAELPVRNAG